MLHGGRTNGMLRALLVSLAATGDPHKDRTTEIMLGIIFVLMLAMVLIGVLEGRKH
jgi:hypothetical protein